jgi:Arc/MetJ-type ribon-helix-helix transcriptional regulator
MTYTNTKEMPPMPRGRIAISLQALLHERIDHLMNKEVFPNRSQPIQAAVEEKLARLKKGSLARECAKLDPRFEKALAEEGLSEELSEWPE